MEYKFAGLFFLSLLPLSCSEPDPLAIVRRSLERDTTNFRRGREYTYQQQVVVRNLGANGQVKKTESSTYDFVTLGDELYSKLIAKNGKPLTGKEAQDAERKFEEAVRKRREESPAARAKRLERRRKSEEEERRFLQEIPEAYRFQLLGEESRDGHAVWVIGAEPRPDFRPKARRAGMLKKFKGRFWIDKNEYQWVRIEAETIDTVSFGFVLARLGKGAVITFEQRRVNDEVWLPSHATARINARVGLVKSFRIQSEVTWSGYQKFQSDSRIVSVEELPDPARK